MRSRYPRLFPRTGDAPSIRRYLATRRYRKPLPASLAWRSCQLTRFCPQPRIALNLRLKPRDGTSQVHPSQSLVLRFPGDASCPIFFFPLLFLPIDTVPSGAAASVHISIAIAIASDITTLLNAVTTVPCNFLAATPLCSDSHQIIHLPAQPAAGGAQILSLHQYKTITHKP